MFNQYCLTYGFSYSFCIETLDCRNLDFDTGFERFNNQSDRLDINYCGNSFIPSFNPNKRQQK